MDDISSDGALNNISPNGWTDRNVCPAFVSREIVGWSVRSSWNRAEFAELFVFLLHGVALLCSTSCQLVLPLSAQATSLRHSLSDRSSPLEEIVTHCLYISI